MFSQGRQKFQQSDYFHLSTYFIFQHIREETSSVSFYYSLSELVKLSIYFHSNWGMCSSLNYPLNTVRLGADYYKWNKLEKLRSCLLNKKGRKHSIKLKDNRHCPKSSFTFDKLIENKAFLFAYKYILIYKVVLLVRNCGSRFMKCCAKSRRKR